MATTATIVTLDLDKTLGQLKRDEGYRQHPYRDSVGVETIGYGFNLQADGLSPDESDCVLLLRVRKRYLTLIAALPWVKSLDEARQGVLLNMAYNLGVAGLLEFRQMLGNVQAGQFNLAAADMLASKWAEQVGSRAQRLAQQMRDGAWQ